MIHASGKIAADFSSSRGILSCWQKWYIEGLPKTLYAGDLYLLLLNFSCAIVSCYKGGKTHGESVENAVPKSLYIVHNWGNRAGIRWLPQAAHNPIVTVEEYERVQWIQDDTKTHLESKKAKLQRLTKNWMLMLKCGPMVKSVRNCSVPNALR